MTRGVVTLTVVTLTACGGEPAGPEPTPISERELRVLAMELLYTAVVAEMRFYVAEGRFTEDPESLDDPRVVPGTEPPGSAGSVAAEVCGDDDIVLLTTRAIEGTVFSVKARGLAPPSAGEAEFGHYTGRPPCDASPGPSTWPGGYFVTRSGLQRRGEG